MATETSALVALSNDVAATVERVAPSVVAVEARSRLGSTGFFVHPTLILTADHALESDEVEIVRADGKSETATIAGRDPSTDIALLRVEKPGEPLEFAKGDTLRVGAIVLAVARDDDGDLAASMGVLSAVGPAWRTWQGGEIDRFVRPDLSLYPRFSGSPLVDVEGKIIGLNTGGLSRRQTLTVPAATILRVTAALHEKGGRLPRGYLGIALQGVSGGAIVLGIEPASPADKAGLIVGDVIVKLGDAAIGDAGDLHRELGADSVGKPVRLSILRGGAPRELEVVVGERSEDHR
ncbi:MAG TPA: trypsin-like peptidase domain-containing protein [Candidatus Elarobacter sp.]